MKVVALIPMKAHSERVKGKNIRLFAGKPLYHYIVAILEQLSFVSRIIINTDSDIIAKEAEKNFSKIQINTRPNELRGDFVPTNDIFAYDIETVEAEHFIQTHCTNPLLTSETLEKAVGLYFKSLEKYDSLFSVTEYKARFFNDEGKPINHNPEELLRTQDLSALYEENSNFYIFSRSSFETAGNKRIGLKPLMFSMNKLEAIDIDEEEDWILAETLYKLRRSKML